jgi:CheY-like chemotaxis protein
MQRGEKVASVAILQGFRPALGSAGTGMRTACFREPVSRPSQLPSDFEPHEAPTLRQRALNARPGPADLLVLVVDDDPDARAVLCGMLYHLGYRVCGCGDGGEAIATALRCHPDVVLMDMAMPGIDGVEATRSLKQHLPSTFVVAMTGLGERYFDAARGSGCDAFFGKPFNPYVLEEILEALRRGKEAEVVKRCSCGREYTRSGWKGLPLLGTMGPVELRNCRCGSSIALGGE